MSALDRIPASAREILRRGDHEGHRLTGAESEQVAVWLLETGIQGVTVTWMAQQIRFRMGVGERPGALPAVTFMERYAAELAGTRAEAIAQRMLEGRKAAA